MRNISSHFKNAQYLNNADWRNDEFYKCIELLKVAGAEVSFWDGEENWASIVVNNELIGYLWKKFPLVILKKSDATASEVISANSQTVIILLVESLEEKELTIDYEIFESSFTNEGPVSAEDVWFYTNC